MEQHDARFDRWLAALEARHLADLTFSEVARALRALSAALKLCRPGGVLEGDEPGADMALL